MYHALGSIQQFLIAQSVDIGTIICIGGELRFPMFTTVIVILTMIAAIWAFNLFKNWRMIMLGDIKNGEKVIAQRVQTSFWTGKQYVKDLTASDLRAEARVEYNREVRDDANREAKLDREYD